MTEPPPRQLAADGPELQEVLRALRANGLSIVQSIAATTRLTGASLADAELLVHTGEAWSDRRADHDAFQDAILEHLDAMESEPVAPPSTGSSRVSADPRIVADDPVRLREALAALPAEQRRELARWLEPDPEAPDANVAASRRRWRRWLRSSPGRWLGRRPAEVDER